MQRLSTVNQIRQKGYKFGIHYQLYNQTQGVHGF